MPTIFYIIYFILRNHSTFTSMKLYLPYLTGLKLYLQYLPYLTGLKLYLQYLPYLTGLKLYLQYLLYFYFILTAKAVQAVH